MFLHLITNSLHAISRPRNVLYLIWFRDCHRPHNNNRIVTAPAALCIVNLREVIEQQLPLMSRAGHETLAVPRCLVQLYLLPRHDVVQVDTFGDWSLARELDAFQVLDEPAGDHTERFVGVALRTITLFGFCGKKILLDIMH